MTESSGAKFSFVLDTNVLFSAIRYRGEAFRLLLLAERAGCRVVVPDYVYEELRTVFERKGIDFSLVDDFLSTFENIILLEIKNFKEDLIEFAKRIPDRKDRPVFLYTIVVHEKEPHTFLVTGDDSFRKAVNEVKSGLSLRVREALQMLEEYLQK